MALVLVQQLVRFPVNQKLCNVAVPLNITLVHHFLHLPSPPTKDYLNPSSIFGS